MVCVALTTGGILLVIRQKSRTGEAYFTLFLLMLVFFSVFGLYNLWGTGFITYLLIPYEESSLLDTLLRFFRALSIPFILAAWVMLIRFEHTIIGKKPRFWLLVIVMIDALALLILAGLFPVHLSDSRWIPSSAGLVNAVVNLAFFFYAGISLLFFRQEKSDWAESRPVFWLGFALLLEGLIQAPGLAYAGSGFWFDTAMTLLYFTSFLLPLFILAKSPLIRKRERPGGEGMKGFRAFCRNHEISPREAEVVMEICQGKSNREISDTLFISFRPSRITPITCLSKQE
jgi:hypothetical protein